MTSNPLLELQASILRRDSTDTEWAALVRDRPALAEALAARLRVLAAEPTPLRPSTPDGLPGIDSWEAALTAGPNSPHRAARAGTIRR
ncbi:hypothetical protein [Streptomyces anulatus]|uniref:hypothetical protein n=1 Tax=Streptomyces anulatus TaxID=1892 RepID=UPI003868F8AA|nr:hypothetical protein OG391_00015 [Streptomyces anulatus]